MTDRTTTWPGLSEWMSLLLVVTEWVYVLVTSLWTLGNGNRPEPQHDMNTMSTTPRQG
jgi:hypothetical protein